MKKSIIIWGAAAILVVVAWFVVRGQGGGDVSGKSVSPSRGSQTTASAQKAIDFTLSDFDGNKVSLSDFKGKYVYLNFWATWCPPCRGEMPGIEKVYEQYGGKDVVVLAVNLGEDGKTVKDFMQKNSYGFRVLLDSDQKVAAQYRINAIPVSYFIDKDGNIVQHVVGALSDEALQSGIQNLISK